MYDVIVVGARCGGAPTAMLLARRGYKVLLADRAKFPSEIRHGHFIHRYGPPRLRDWGLLDRVLATGCPAITAMTTDLGDFPLTGRNLVVDGVPLGCGPRRGVLDKLLVDAAAEAGAEVREGYAVLEYLAEDGRIAGIRGQDVETRTVSVERARVTVGADGRNSRLAQQVGAAVYAAEPPLTFWYFSYWSGVPARGVEVHVRGDKVIFAFPTSGGAFAVFVAWRTSEFETVRRDIEGQFFAALDQAPELSGLVRGGRREERFYGATDVPNFFRKPYGPGWALVGDAGCHKDPFLALGICDAFRDAGWLAEALDEGLAGQRPLDEALGDFERRRNEASRPDYERNLASARFLPPPADVIALRAALRHNQAATDQFYLATQGMIARESFFNPENVGRLIGEAGARSGRSNSV